jgi:hypothetical protein
VKEFVSDLEEVTEKLRAGDPKGLDQLVSRLRRRITIVESTVGGLVDATQAAIEVQTDLSAWYRDAYAKCATDRNAYPFRAGGFVCLAAIDRLYQGRNVKHVLGDQDGSFARRGLPARDLITRKALR